MDKNRPVRLFVFGRVFSGVEWMDGEERRKDAILQFERNVLLAPRDPFFLALIALRDHISPEPAPVLFLSLSPW